jgi:hypothetical protein
MYVIEICLESGWVKGKITENWNKGGSKIKRGVEIVAVRINK